MIMEIWLKILAALSPALVLAIVLVRKDLRPEPLRWLLAAAGFGVLTGFGVLLLGFTVLPNVSTDTYFGAMVSSFIDAAIPEELLKFCALYLVARKCRHFDEAFDGVVYAVCIGMGFAGLENVLYLFGADDEWVMVGVSRALLAVPAHYFFAVIMGSLFSLGWFDTRHRTRYMTLALIAPIAVHGVYDTLCFSMAIDEALSGIILLAFILGFNFIRKCSRQLIQLMLKIDRYVLAEKEI